MIRFALILTFLVTGKVAWARKCEPILNERALESAFAKIYLQPGIYHDRQCGVNVKSLLLELQRRGFATEKAKVLFLLHEMRRISGGLSMPTKLLPHHNRQNVPSWDFHVILQLGDQILDLDGRAKPLPIIEYFNQMFPGGPARWANIALREVPATEYLRAFEDYERTRDRRLSPDENYVVGAFRPLNLPGYPVTNVRDYLGQ